MAVTRTLGAQFEILIEGKPRSYRDRKTVAMEAAEYLKRKHPHSEVVVKDRRTSQAGAANQGLPIGPRPR